MGKLLNGDDTEGSRLWVLAEARLYHSKQLIEDAKLQETYDFVLGAGAGEQLVSGEPAERKQALEEQLPEGHEQVAYAGDAPEAPATANGNPAGGGPGGPGGPGGGGFGGPGGPGGGGGFGGPGGAPGAPSAPGAPGGGNAPQKKGNQKKGGQSRAGSRQTTVGGGQEKVSARQKGDSEMVGKPAPAISLKRLYQAKGTTFTLASHKNKDVVILNFWATKYPPCRQALPILEKVVKEYEDQGVVLCSINVEEKKDTIRNFLKEQSLDVDDVVLDSDGRVAKKYNVTTPPTMVIVDKNGNIAHVKAGVSGELEEDLHELLDDLVRA
jgi:thiol-disulfide isomerase/thioredoxin